MTQYIIISILIIVSFMFGMVWLANTVNHNQCKNNVTEMGRNYRYDSVNGCRIQLDDGTYIYWKMFRELGE